MRTLRATKILCFLGFCTILTPELQGQNKGLSVVRQWKQLDYNYASDFERQEAIASGEFTPGNGLPIDVDVYYGPNHEQKIFVTVPRFVNGTPGTLNTLTDLTNNGNPLLEPFPSWEWHRGSSQCNRDRLISVFRIQLDECGRLWVLDTGKIGSDQVCNPQIIAFDPHTAQVLHRYEIPRDQILHTSILVTPAVDVRDPLNGCQDTFVYSADVTGFGLIVYDVRKGRSWRIQNKLFYPIPEWGTFTIANESFDLMDGILGLSLSPYRPGTDRVLYFHAMASNTENYVYTSIIRNESIFHEHEDAAPREFNVYRKTRPSQAAAEAVDRNGIMYFASIQEIKMYCWDTRKSFERNHFDVIDSNKDNLQFPSGVKIVNTRRGGQELWVVTNRIQKSYTGSMSADEVNFRILYANTADLVLNTKCQRRHNGGGGGGGSYGNRPSFSYGKGSTASASTASAVSAASTASGEPEDKFVFSN